MRLRSRAAAAALILIFARPLAGAEDDRPDVFLTLEVRVFDGAKEVSSECRVIVYPSGERAKAQTASAPLHWTLPPGRYDAEGVLAHESVVEKVKGAIGWTLQPYPDEQDSHLEVINFQSGYGAVKIVPVRERVMAAAQAEASVDFSRLLIPVSRGQSASPASSRFDGTIVRGSSYWLLVAPAGRYPVTVKPVGGGENTVIRREVDVVAERIRVQQVELK